ncbi:hypothetical protein ACFQ3Z_02975 [Streptomyces nogalater]
MPTDLAGQARALLRGAEAAQAALARLRQEVTAEQQRVAEQAWRTASSSPVMRAFLDSAAPALADDIERRLAAASRGPASSCANAPPTCGASWAGPR